MPRYTYGKNGMAMREAETESGRVRGIAAGNPRFTVFKGIPYAAPPVGELRWKEAQPAPAWEGVRDCCKYSDIPIQFGRGAEGADIYGRQSEDCLYLNIWTPAEREDEKLPVLFWTYGGAFVGGCANTGRFEGEGFCKRGVILVTYNYRAGALGLMAHPELSAETGHGSGNYYYLDQVAALKWVRRNIAHFGGDPDKITIMGHSSGAAATTALACTPLTKGDMRAASINSAIVARDFDGPGEMWLPLEKAEERGLEYMELCGCENIAQMRALPVEGLTKAFRKLKRGMFTFCGTIDGYLFSDNPTHMYYRGENHDIAYLLGDTIDEGKALIAHGGKSFLLTREQLPEYAKNFGGQAEDFLKFCGTLPEDEIINAMTDGSGMRNRQQAVNQLRHGRKPAWLFCFTRRLPGDNAGACHGAELPYIFQTLQNDWRPYAASDYELSEQLADYWANFVKTGNPNGVGLTEWTPFTEESPESLMIDVAPFMCERKLPKIQLYKIDYLTGTDEVDSFI